MKNLFYLFGFALFVSCGNNTITKKEEHQTNDSSMNATKNFVFAEKEFKQFDLPFAIDTLFIQKLDTNNRISYSQVRALSVNFLQGELGDGLSYDLNEFCKIDSLKQVGKYNDYISKLDIGMTKISIAYKVGFLKLNETNKLFIWGITSSSYEACPFFAGTKLIAVFLTGNNEAVQFKIAEISSGGDPPSMGSEQTTAHIKASGDLTVNTVSIVDDIDTPGNETTTKTVSLKVEKDKIVLVDSKQEVNNTEKTAQ